MSDYALDGQM